MIAGSVWPGLGAFGRDTDGFLGVGDGPRVVA
jgi:hypothetical protein